MGNKYNHTYGDAYYAYRRKDKTKNKNKPEKQKQTNEKFKNQTNHNRHNWNHTWASQLAFYTRHHLIDIIILIIQRTIHNE